jgi:hypothetical protein
MWGGVGACDPTRRDWREIACGPNPQTGIRKRTPYPFGKARVADITLGYPPGYPPLPLRYGERLRASSERRRGWP